MARSVLGTDRSVLGTDKFCEEGGEEGVAGGLDGAEGKGGIGGSLAQEGIKGTVAPGESQGIRRGFNRRD